jgi:hypothetical protein
LTAPTQKHLSPHAGSLSQSVLAFVVVLVFVLTTQDPVLALFTWLTQLGTLGIIVLMALASFAVTRLLRAAQRLRLQHVPHHHRADRWRACNVGRCDIRGFLVRAAHRQPRESAALDLACLDHLGSSRGSSRGDQLEETLTGVVRPDGPASRYRAVARGLAKGSNNSVPQPTHTLSVAGVTPSHCWQKMTRCRGVIIFQSAAK